MKPAGKPIKRSKQLAPLSCEHHDGLLFVWKIRQGFSNHTQITKMQQYTMWYWQQHIKPLFFREEKILLPHMKSNHPMTTRFKEEHDQIRELILGLDKEADKRYLVLLVDLIESHIRFEERELFNFLEQSLSSDELEEIFVKLEKQKINCTVWADEFWIRK